MGISDPQKERTTCLQEQRPRPREGLGIPAAWPIWDPQINHCPMHHLIARGTQALLCPTLRPHGL